MLNLLTAVEEMTKSSYMPNYGVEASQRMVMCETGNAMIFGKAMPLFENNINKNNKALEANDGTAVENSIPVKYAFLPVPTMEGVTETCFGSVDGLIALRNNNTNDEHLKNVCLFLDYLCSGERAAAVDQTLLLDPVCKSGREAYVSPEGLDEGNVKSAARAIGLVVAPPAGITSEQSANAKILMDEVLPYGLDNLLVTLILVFSMVSITNTLVGFVRQWVLIHLSIKIDIPLMLGYFGHIFHLPMKFFATRKTGDITTRYSDANTIKSIFTSIALSLIMDISMAIITGIILFRMNAMLFSISLFMALVSILLVLIYKQPYKKINEETMVQSAALNSQMIESLRGIETVKCNANEDTEMENLEREYIKSLKISLRSSKISTTQGLISSFISTGFSMLTTYVGISQVLKGEMTLGGFMAFSTLSSYFTSPLSNLIGLQMQIQEASISMKRLGEIMDYPSETVGDEDRTDLDKVEGDIEFKDVTFRYGNRAPALDHISFTIPAGKKVALVGSSGSGKSTITKLLLKYYEPEDGEIDLNGVNLAEYTNDSVRRAISYVPQNVELFSKTIFENIRISRPEATLDQVREAAKKADAHEFIRKLPLQYNTYLEEAGNGLSGGEKQRLALARAFLKDANLYILDESTSSLDFGTENTIFDMIYNQLADRSMLIVAHRLSTIRDCDLILVMDHGQIVERGTHDELLAKQGAYSRLFTAQKQLETLGKEDA